MLPSNCNVRLESPPPCCLGTGLARPDWDALKSRLFITTAMLLTAIAAPDKEGFSAMPYAGMSAPAAI